MSALRLAASAGAALSTETQSGWLDGWTGWLDGHTTSLPSSLPTVFNVGSLPSYVGIRVGTFLYVAMGEP